MPAAVVVTGARGRVGRALVPALGSGVVALDLPEHDVRDLTGLLTALPLGCAVVHLAWDIPGENYDTGTTDPDNLEMVRTVLRAAAERRARRVVLASSVHAGGVRLRRPWERRLAPDRAGDPATPYGRSKARAEQLGREAAAGGLEVVALRLGGVAPAPLEDPLERSLWLSERDLVAAVRAALDVPVVPGGCAVAYAVSRNPRGLHSTRSVLGWHPLDGAPRRVRGAARLRRYARALRSSTSATDAATSGATADVE
ncbi:NAD-dependent epimerase/dehydratase family protein [Motilibacter rhizosphaerae]|uniref:NAD-dependent epimerase/dehydratase family protein n=1 Tax=Motilibacter rhizosphaerae TaxID=598652 RepID=A0A4V2F536_9ACTN|nr:NAD(P)-dependent oxidoreductase [Motilibacter rhizosphaerae]RZS91449.1 NAD-dependent epimerase/dehydratase family protein [Motilibacter rhizosphaerae]